jgi:hypothetical protein
MRARVPVDPAAAHVARWPGGLSSETVAEHVHIIDVPDAAEVLSLMAPGIGVEAVAVLARRSEGPRVDQAVGHLRDGLDLARTCVPDLVDDLLPHVSCVAFLDDADGRCPIHSATLRAVPGLLLMAEPRSAVAAAEMFVHEAAHARLFDMMMVLDLVRPGDGSAGFCPPWRGPDVVWPVEQCVAAAHAYAALAELARSLPEGMVLASWSLLGHAAERASSIVDWLSDHVDRLGTDAPKFLGRLRGRRMEVRRRTNTAKETVTWVRAAPGVKVGDENETGTVAVRGDLVTVLDPASGELLKWLAQRPSSSAHFSEIIRARSAWMAASGLHTVRRGQVRRSIVGRLSMLADLDLVELPRHREFRSLGRR